MAKFCTEVLGTFPPGVITRFHCPPRKARPRKTPKQRYLFERSYERYLKTDDARRVQEMSENFTGEFGRVDGIRFIMAEEL
jgi:hypothetical protein